MTLKSSFRLSLNKINISSQKTSEIIDGHDLEFDLVKLEETSYLNFVQLSNNLDPSVLKPMENFVKLITTPQYVSLTFNTFFIDQSNQKVLFVPSILPNYTYEFDFVDNPELITKLNDELSETCLDLGCLHLKDLQMDLIDYNYENGKLHAVLDTTY